MTNPKAIKQWEYVATDDTSEFNDGKSLTIPNEAYSIKEVLEKFTSGINLPIQRNGQFDENPDFDTADITRDPAADIYDITTALQVNQAKISEAEAKKAKAIKGKAEKKAEDERKELIKKELTTQEEAIESEEKP